MTRGRGKLVVIAAATIGCLYLTYLLAWPFMPALVWAVTAAVVTQPLVHWLERRIRRPRWRAAAATFIVAVVIFVPVIAMVTFAAVEISRVVQNWQPAEFDKQWQQTLGAHQNVTATWEKLTSNFDLTGAVEQFVQQIQAGATAIVSVSVYSIFQAMLTLFVLFFLYRDQQSVLDHAKQLSPLTSAETDRLLKRLEDTIHATVFGILIVAMIQGVLGGTIFWLLGLPAPVMWGTVMATLSVVPYLGSFVIWLPTAAILAFSGEWGKAIGLVSWGLIVIGLIDNLLYPMLVGTRLRQHTVIAFIAIVGGIAIFGAPGIVLGPVVISLTFFLMQTWQRRTVSA